MYEIELTTNDKYYDAYYFKTKNENNQTLQLDIIDSTSSELSTFKTYYISFSINTKRKHGYQYLKQTGKDGIKSLIWAKKCIKYFIKHNLKNGDKIVIYADDSRRFNIYAKGLKELKFDITKVNNRKALIYKHV